MLLPPNIAIHMSEEEKKFFDIVPSREQMQTKAISLANSTRELKRMLDVLDTTLRKYAEDTSCHHPHNLIDFMQVWELSAGMIPHVISLLCFTHVFHHDHSGGDDLKRVREFREARVDIEGPLRSALSTIMRMELELLMTAAAAQARSN